MASRMDRYNNLSGRSEKNKGLYEQINELDTYTNIEGYTDISSGNEISMDTVRELIKENSKKEAEYKRQEIKEIEHKEEKNYDIKDILNKAKIDHTSDDNRYRSLKTSQYDILKNIKIEDFDDAEELKSIIDTLSLGGQNSDDLGLLDELKSNTMVGDASSIKKIINEAKEEDEKEKTTDNLTNVDTSFFSSSFSFSDKDFEDLKSIEDSPKDKSKVMNILIIIFSILIAIAVLILVAKFVF